MTTRFKLLAVAMLAIGLITGCVTNQTPLTPEQKTEQRIKRATRIAEAAAFDTALIEMKDKNNTPQNRAMFAGITNQLSGFLGATNISPTDVAAYISTLPIKQLKTTEGQMIAGGVLMIVDEVIGDTYAVDASKLTPVIAAAIKGFGRAIQFAEANPYVPPAPKPPKNTNTVSIMPPVPPLRVRSGVPFIAVQPTIVLEWNTNVLHRVTLQESSDMATWSDIGNIADGRFVVGLPSEPQRFYRALPCPEMRWQATEGAVGYRVYVGGESQSYSAVVDVGSALTSSLSGLKPKTYYFAVTAYNSGGFESNLSEEVRYDAPVIEIRIRRS